MTMMAVVEGVHVKLWIKSNRGTDSHEIVVLPKSLVSDKRAMNAYLESWCEKFGAWNHGDNGSIRLHAHLQSHG